jgi:hypothetical protein
MYSSQTHPLVDQLDWYMSQMIDVRHICMHNFPLECRARTHAKLSTSNPLEFPSSMHRSSRCICNSCDTQTCSSTSVVGASCCLPVLIQKMVESVLIHCDVWKCLSHCHVRICVKHCACGHVRQNGMTRLCLLHCDIYL